MVEKNKGSVGGRGKKRGLTRAVVSLEPKQVDALRAEAMQRMVERKVGRMDTGEVVREAVDQWTRVRELTQRIFAAGDQALGAVAKAVAAGDSETALGLLGIVEGLVQTSEEMLGSNPGSQRMRAAIEATRAELAGKRKGAKP